MMNYTRMEVAAKIDHAALKPETTVDDLKRDAAMCIRERVASLCVRPCDVALAAKLLKNTGVAVSCTLSFPHGADVAEVKALQARRAIDDGATEIDMVMNVGRFLSGDYDYVVEDIRAVVSVARSTGAKVKVIQESGLLSADQVAEACKLSLLAGADFVKTSTGFGPGGATPDIIAVMLRAVGGKMGVKASGGIRDWTAATAYLRQGVDRLGVGATEAVLDGCPSRNSLPNELTN